MHIVFICVDRYLRSHCVAGLLPDLTVVLCVYIVRVFGCRPVGLPKEGPPVSVPVRIPACILHSPTRIFQGL